MHQITALQGPLAVFKGHFIRRGKNGRRKEGRGKGINRTSEGKGGLPLPIRSLNAAVEEGRKGEGQGEELYIGFGVRLFFFH